MLCDFCTFLRTLISCLLPFFLFSDFSSGSLSSLPLPISAASSVHIVGVCLPNFLRQYSGMLSLFTQAVFSMILPHGNDVPRCSKSSLGKIRSRDSSSLYLHLNLKICSGSGPVSLCSYGPDSMGSPEDLKTMLHVDFHSCLYFHRNLNHPFLAQPSAA